MQSSPRLEEALADLSCRGLPAEGLAAALEALLGSHTAGFSATALTHMVKVWQEEYHTWGKHPLTERPHTYIKTDGFYFLGSHWVIGQFPTSKTGRSTSSSNI